MKKVIYLILFVIFLAQSSSSQTLNCRVDTINVYAYNPGSTIRNIGRRIIYAYNAAGLETEELNQDWFASSGLWGNNDKTDITYNAAGQIIHNIYQTYYINGWQNATQFDITYNTAGEETGIVNQEWNINTHAWVNIGKFEYSYNTEGLESQTLFQHWDIDNNAWLNVSKTDNSYNTSGQEIQYISQYWNSTDNVWVNSSKNDKTYNAAGLKSQEISQNWNSTTNAWVNYDKIDNTYNSTGQRTQYIRQTWNSATKAWVNQTKYEDAFNIGGQVTLEIAFGWNTTTNAWDNSSKLDYTYNAGGLLTFSLRQIWSTATNAWINSSKTDFAYNAGGQPIQTISEVWDLSINAWINYNKDDFTYYDANGCLQLRDIFQNWNAATSDFTTHTEFEYFSTFNGNLPVSLLLFSVQKKQADVLINWQTTGELNFNHYEVERSIDGIIFKKIGAVSLQAGYGIKKYNYNDENAVAAFRKNKNLYYRLMMVDNDGKFKYSQVASVALDKIPSVSIYPNPAKDKLQIDGIYNYRIIKIADITGKIILIQNASVKPIDISRLQKGVYIITICGDDGSISLKFIKE